MKLSEQLEQDHNGGDFGQALEGYAERARVLEGKIIDLTDAHASMISIYDKLLIESKKAAELSDNK